MDSAILSKLWKSQGLKIISRTPWLWVAMGLLTPDPTLGTPGLQLQYQSKANKESTKITTA